MLADPVGGAGVGVVQCTLHGHKYLGLRYLAGAGVHDRRRLAGVVHKEFVAGFMGLAHGAFQASGPGLVLLANGAVLVRLTAVMLLLLDVVVLGLQMVLRAGHGRFVQPGLERFVAQGLGQRPVNAGHARVAGDFADSGYGDAEGCADLVGCSTSRRAAVSVCVVFCSW